MDPEIGELEARLEAIGSAPEDTHARVDALAALAWAVRLTDGVRANRLATEARALSLSIGYTLGQARAARVLGMTRGESTTQLSDHIAFGEEAQRLFDEVGDRAGSAGSRDFLASLFEYVGDFSTAMELAREALGIAREIGDPVRQAFALCNVSGILATLGDGDRALEHAREALDLFEGADHHQGIARICSLLSKLHRERGELSEARTYAQRLHESARRSGAPDDKATALAVLGELEQQQGHREDAERLFRESLTAYHSDEARSVMGTTARANLARLLTERGALEEAEEQLARALEGLGTIESGSTEHQANIRQALADVYERRGEFDRACGQLREVVELRRRVAQSELRDKLAQLEARAQVKAARQEAEIHRLKFVELSTMQAKLVEAEKMAQLGTLAAGTAHELNSPLGVLQSNLSSYARAAEELSQLAAFDPDSRSRVEKLDKVLSACRRTSEHAIERMAGLADTFKRFTQLDLAEQRTFDVADGLDAAVSLLRPGLPPGVALEVHFEPVPKLLGWPGQLNQAFMTVLLNAIQAVDGSGTVVVETIHGASVVVVRIRDDGRGMSQEEREHVFDVGWSAKGPRTKLRLGLSAVRATVERHRGRVEVESALGRGTTFELTFPLPAA